MAQIEATQAKKRGNPLPPSELGLQREIAQGLVDQEDGQDVLAYIKQQSTLKKWKRGTTDRHFQTLRPLLRQIRSQGKTLATLDENSTLDLIRHLQNHPTWSEDTRPGNWERFQTFYKWAAKRRGQAWDESVKKYMIGEEKYVYKKDRNKITPKDTFQPHEILQIVNAESDLEYKTFIAVTFEAGMRVGEALGLRLKDVEHMKDGNYTLHLAVSKTDKRPIPLEVYSPPYLAKWLKLHPDGKNPEAWLFVNTKGQRLQNATANKRLRLLARKLFPAKTKVSVHSLRHSRATELASMMTEAQLCKFFGWRIGSRMPQTYIRAGAIDIRAAIRKGYGIEKQEESRIQGQKCLHCSHINAYDTQYCDNCSLPLDPARLEAVKRNVDAVRMEALLKQHLMTARADILEQLRREMRGDSK